ncbi:MAG TPA: hypothetical protein VEW26_11640 [Allosphingosinicella sp.]|nr:hypothetical protein [Allosphingosinicella sp.]
MDEREDQESGPVTEEKARWTAPEVDRLVAGGAEAGGDTSTDGIDILS